MVTLSPEAEIAIQGSMPITGELTGAGGKSPEAQSFATNLLAQMATLERIMEKHADLDNIPKAELVDTAVAELGASDITSKGQSNPDGLEFAKSVKKGIENNIVNLERKMPDIEHAHDEANNIVSFRTKVNASKNASTERIR